MKNSKQILSSLTKQPHFGSLAQHSCYQKFMALLPPRFQKAVAFIYIKNRTLFMALSHPGYKMELNYNKELFKGLLETLAEHKPECKELVADDVILFNSKYHTPKVFTDATTVPYYSELSSGNFDIDFHSQEIKEKFMKSKELISKNLSMQTN